MLYFTTGGLKNVPRSFNKPPPLLVRHPRGARPHGAPAHHLWGLPRGLCGRATRSGRGCGIPSGLPRLARSPACVGAPGYGGDPAAATGGPSVGPAAATRQRFVTPRALDDAALVGVSNRALHGN